MEHSDKKTESTGPKTYPHSEEDITYEQEIIDEIKKLPLEQRIQFIALNNITLKKKQLEEELDYAIDKIVQKYNKLETPAFDRVFSSFYFSHLRAMTSFLVLLLLKSKKLVKPNPNSAITILFNCKQPLLPPPSPTTGSRFSLHASD